jgi:dihydrofolate synthase/folylpolyglutamate synthase
VHDELAALDQLRATLGVRAGTDPQPDHLRRLLDALGTPQAAYGTVHVGGTSGKGSVAATVASILSAHGLRTGLHLSPYVQVLTEAWQLDGHNVLPSTALASARALPGTSSYFEAKAALAFLLFRDQRVDRAVVEVGVGGRSDVTNVLGAGVKVLTNVGLDHTDVLGDTVERIAAHKTGIFRPGSPVVSGVSQPSVREIVAAACDRLGAPLWLLGANLFVERTAARRLTVHLEERLEIAVEVPADRHRFQDVNAGLAVAAAARSLGRDLDPELCAAAISRVVLPGRCEVFSSCTGTTVLDGAHNEDKLTATLTAIGARFPGRPIVGVVALKAGKDVGGIVALLPKYLTAVVFTTFDAGPWKCVPPAELAAMARLDGVDARDDPGEALARARELSGVDGVVVVTGSFYLVGNVRGGWVPNREAVLHGGSYAGGAHPGDRMRAAERRLSS